MAETLKARLIRHEGIRLKVYRDSLGIETIGCGRNLRDRGITYPEALVLLDNDIAIAEAELFVAFPWMLTLTQTRREVFVELAFNMGVPRLKGFAKALAAAEDGDWETCADELLDSTWATQVKGRAVTLATIIRTGQPLA